MTWEETELPAVCSNLNCKNTPEAGRFLVMESLQKVVDPGYSLKFWLCYPCARGLKRLSGG